MRITSSTLAASVCLAWANSKPTNAAAESSSLRGGAALPPRRQLSTTTTHTYIATNKIWGLCSDGMEEVDTEYTGTVCATHADGSEDILWESMTTLNPRDENLECSWVAAEKSNTWKTKWTGGCGEAPTELPYLPTKVHELRTYSYSYSHTVKGLCTNGIHEVQTVYTGRACTINADGSHDIEWLGMKTPNPTISDTSKTCAWDAAEKSDSWKTHWTGGCGVAPLKLPELPTQLEDILWYLGETLYLAFQNGDEDDFFSYTYLKHDPSQSAPTTINGFPGFDGTTQWQLLNNYVNDQTIFQLQNVASGLCLVHGSSSSLTFHSCSTSNIQHYWYYNGNGKVVSADDSSSAASLSLGCLTAGTDCSRPEEESIPSGLEVLGSTPQTSCDSVQKIQLMRNFMYDFTGTYTPITPIQNPSTNYKSGICSTATCEEEHLEIQGRTLANARWLMNIDFLSYSDTGMSYLVTWTIGATTYQFHRSVHFKGSGSWEAPTHEKVPVVSWDWNPPKVDYLYAGQNFVRSTELSLAIGLFQGASWWSNVDHENDQITLTADGVENGRNGFYVFGGMVFQKIHEDCSTHSDCASDDEICNKSNFCTKCDNGSTRVISPAGRGFCYFPKGGLSMDWDGAAYKCSSLGLGLVHIKDEEKLNDIDSFATSDYTWLGLTCDGVQFCDNKLTSTRTSVGDVGWKWSGHNGLETLVADGPQVEGGGFYDPDVYGATAPLRKGDDGSLLGGGGNSREYCAYWWGGEAKWGPHRCGDSTSFGALCE